MRWIRNYRSAFVAGALVSAVAAAPFLTGPQAEAKPSASFTTDRDNTRDVHPKRGPFYGLRVNSMDVESAVKVVSCYQYRCPAPGDAAPETYQLVRSVQVDRDIELEKCDEVFSPLAQTDASVRFRADSKTTRWIRDKGPNGVTPVGGFIGKMVVTVIVSKNGVVTRAPFMNIGLIGTQGLRPRRGDTTLAPDAEEPDRCSAPLHDEGYYQGRTDRRGVRVLRRFYREDDRRLAHLKTLSKSLLVGTFEGRMGLDVDRANEFDFCQLRKVVWWMDGVAGYRCRQDTPAPNVPAPEPLPEDEELFEDVPRNVK